MEREAKIQDALKNLIESTAKKSRFEGLEITRVERDHPDLMHLQKSSYFKVRKQL